MSGLCEICGELPSSVRVCHHCADPDLPQDIKEIWSEEKFSLEEMQAITALGRAARDKHPLVARRALSALSSLCICTGIVTACAACATLRSPYGKRG